MDHAERTLDALVVADVHLVEAADHVCPLEARKCALGRVLLARAYEALIARGIAIDVAILMGDAVDEIRAAGAEQDLAAVAETMHGWGVPLLAVPGNHDGDVGRYAEIMGCAPGLHEVGGVGFLAFADLSPASVSGGESARPGSGLAGGVPAQSTGTSGEKGTGTSGGEKKDKAMVRAAEGLRLVGEVAAARPDLPLVALQHAVLHPPIERDYPYMLANHAAVMRSYEAAGVVLSLSGHYHAGQAPCVAGGVTYYTAPALCEAPHRFAHVRFEGRRATVWEVEVAGV
jgi:hypothetical protein